MSNVDNYVDTGSTTARIPTNITSTSSYTYTTVTTEKNCSTCSHQNVCKYREKTERAIQKVKLPEEIGNIKIALECEYYLAQYYSYPSPVWYNTNQNDKWAKPPYEVTCTCNCSVDSESSK